MKRRKAIALIAAASPLANAQSKSELFRVSVIGHTGRGDYGHGLDTMWKAIPRASLVSVADADPKGLARALKKLELKEGFADYRDMLSEVKPDLVAIAPRHVDQHHAMCLAAMEAGVKGIYIEKPYCRTPKEADEIGAACAKSGVKLAIAHRNRYHPALPMALKLIQDGFLGKVLEVRGRGKEDHRGGALDLWVLGSHVLDLANYLTGPSTAASASLYQDGKPCTPDDIKEGAEGVGPLAGNQLHARFETSSGFPLFFDSIAKHGGNGRSFGLRVIGSEATMELRCDAEPLIFIRKGKPIDKDAGGNQWRPVTSLGVDKATPEENLKHRLGKHLIPGNDLINAIIENRQPICGPAEGSAIVEMIHGVFASHQADGKRVELPLTSRTHGLVRKK